MVVVKLSIVVWCSIVFGRRIRSGVASMPDIGRELGGEMVRNVRKSRRQEDVHYTQNGSI